MRKVEFGEIATFSQGQQVSIPGQKIEKFDGCDTFLRIVNYTQNSDDFRYIPKQSHKHHVSTDDIIMVRYGAVGFVGRGLSGVLANNMFKINFDKDQVDGNYLFRTLWSDFVQKQLLNASQSTSMAAINFKTTSKITIPLPPLDQQKKIAAILDAADAYRQKTKALIKKYDELTQSLFLEMFGDPVSNPMEWDVKPLKDFGKIVTGNTPSRRNEDYYSTNFIEWIKTGNISSENQYITNAEEYLSKEGLKNGRFVNEGSLLVACIAGSIQSIGRAALTDRKVAFNQQINAIEPHIEVSSLFLYHLFRNSLRYIQDHATHGMKRMLSKGDFQKILMIKPPIELQNQFANSVKAIEAQKAQAQASLAQAEDLFNSLLQRAFKGELS
jgi:type I restriction enzyme, S subunit